MSTIDDDPMWHESTTFISDAAAKNGSQYRFLSKRDGQPCLCGRSEKITLRAPRGTVRSSSATANRGSQNGTRIPGMNRPGAVAHHSSTTKSLYAWMQARA